MIESESVGCRVDIENKGFEAASKTRRLIHLGPSSNSRRSDLHLIGLFDDHPKAKEKKTFVWDALG